MKRDELKRFTIEREGLALAAYDSGGDGLLVVFQHGLCGDIGQVAEAFPDKRYLRLIGLECRGHGASQAGHDVSIALFADDVVALIETIGAPVVLGGISMGAAISSRIAVKRPDLVHGLVLARPAWVAQAGPENMRPNAEVGALLEKLSPDMARAAFEASETHEMLAREAPDNLESLMGFFDREPTDVTAQLLMRISADGPGISEEDLTALAVPTMVLATARDVIHPMAHAERLAALIQGAKLVEITPKGIDKSAYTSEFHAALSAFLKGF
ncbi:alpha/beta hydrolase [Mesorhizobium sp. VNQ89]|uniref:alpha/beta fold hydrolase n=1 Tax=Mesorhizobium quangtriensis TaxID=3157709 RepID=UPI0032B7CC14